MASTSLEMLATKFRAAATDVGNLGLISVLAGAKIVEGSVAVASGGYRGSRLTATRSVVLSTSPAVARVWMPSRLAHLLDQDTAAHDIYPKAATFLATGPATFIAHAHHPGTKGKRMWEQGVAVALPQIANVSSSTLSTMIGRWLG